MPCELFSLEKLRRSQYFGYFVERIGQTFRAVAGLNRDTGERRTAAYALGPYSVVDTGEFRKSF
jgi:hypothetical protein